MAEVQINTAANSIQIMCEVSGIAGPDGRITKNLHLKSAGVSMNLPAEAFPFLEQGGMALVVLSVVQSKPVQEEPAILARPGLILPGR